MCDVYTPLLTYKHAKGEAGTEVVPGLAKNMPEISRTARPTSSLRPNMKYSDGTPIKASDFTYAIKRLFKTQLRRLGVLRRHRRRENSPTASPTPSAGSRPTTTPATSRSPGRARGTFENVLGADVRRACPPSTPLDKTTTNPPPASGPFMITKSAPIRGWDYERNPYWATGASEARPRYPTRTSTRSPSPRTKQLDPGHRYRAEQDRLHADPPDSDRLPGGQEPSSPDPFRLENSINTYYFWMNTQKARSTISRSVRPSTTPSTRRRSTGSSAGALHPTQQILPPGMPGYEEFEFYPGDMEKAKELIAEANGRPDITVWTDDEPKRSGWRVLPRPAHPAGFQRHIESAHGDAYFTHRQRVDPGPRHRLADWFQDFPHPDDFFRPLLDGENILPTNSNNFARNQRSRSSTTKINKLGEEALGPEQEKEYAELDKAYMEQALWAPYGNGTSRPSCRTRSTSKA